MASKGYTGIGAVLSIGSEAAGGTWTPVVIGQVKNPQLNGQKWSFDDISNLQSPQVGTGALKESIPSVVDPGELTLDVIFLPADAGQLALSAAFTAGLLRDFQLQLPKGPSQSTAGNLYAFRLRAGLPRAAGAV